MKSKEQSPLVKAVLALDEHFQELDRLGTKINSLEMKSDFDFEHAQRLLARYAECGEGVASEIALLSQHLNEARARSETVAQGVAERAALLMSRKTDQRKKMDEFHDLGEKVKALNLTISELRRPEGHVYSAEERAGVALTLSEVEGRLGELIEAAQNMRKDAQAAKMKALEQNADSLTQTLQTIRTKLGSLHMVQH